MIQSMRNMQYLKLYIEQSKNYRDERKKERKKEMNRREREGCVGCAREQ